MLPLLLTCEKGSFTEVKKVEGGGGLGQGAPRKLFPPREQRQPRRVRGDRGRHRPHPVGHAPTGAVQFGGAHHRRRAGVRRRLEPLLQRLRCKVGNAALADPSQHVPAGLSSLPCRVAGRQFMAMPVGVGAASWGTDIPLKFTPELKRPNSGNALFVFTLP